MTQVSLTHKPCINYKNKKTDIGYGFLKKKELDIIGFYLETIIGHHLKNKKTKQTKPVCMNGLKNSRTHIKRQQDCCSEERSKLIRNNGSICWSEVH